MARLTGIVRLDGKPADGAYVQLQNDSGDFQGEVRTDADGKFVLYPSPGRWRLVSWLPPAARGEQNIDVTGEDLDVRLDLK